MRSIRLIVVIAAGASPLAPQSKPAPNSTASERKAVSRAGQRRPVQQQAGSGASKSSAFSTWLAKTFRIDPDILLRMSVPRGGASQIVATRILRADLVDHSETQVAKCDACWSLTPLSGDRLAVLKSDGIWLVDAKGGDLRPALEARDLEKIIGQTADAAGTLLVASRTLERECEFRLESVDLATGRREPQPLPFGCLTEGDLGALLRPAALRSRKYLSASEPGPDPMRLLIAAIAPGSEPPAPNYPLLAWLDKAAARIGRFDPVWLSDRSVAYLASQ